MVEVGALAPPVTCRTIIEPLTDKNTQVVKIGPAVSCKVAIGANSRPSLSAKAPGLTRPETGVIKLIDPPVISLIVIKCTKIVIRLADSNVTRTAVIDLGKTCPEINSVHVSKITSDPAKSYIRRYICGTIIRAGERSSQRKWHCSESPDISRPGFNAVDLINPPVICPAAFEIANRIWYGHSCKWKRRAGNFC